jgi:ABC-2 type transport system permease protein
MMLSKYLTGFRLKFQENLAYRANFWITFTVGIFPLVMSIYFWSIIFFYNSSDTVSGYTLTEMITYFILVYFVTRVTEARRTSSETAEDIRSGAMNNYLIKPVDYISFKFASHIAEKICYLAMTIIPMTAALFLMRQYVFVNNSVVIFTAVFSLCLSVIIQFHINLITGMLTFWFEECSALFDLMENVNGFLSGRMFPLRMLPSGLFSIASFLPFMYTVFLPIDIYMGTVTGIDLARKLGMQFLWALFLALFARHVWKKGCKKNAAVGI